MAKFLAGDRMAGFKIPMSLGALASGATNTAQEICRFVAPHAMKLAAAYVTFISALTGAATNYVSVWVRNRGTAGTGTVEMATLAFSTTAVIAAADIARALTIEATTVANLLIEEGEQVSIKIGTGGGSGAVYPIGHFHAHFTLQ
jgi:hypothetical protein